MKLSVIVPVFNEEKTIRQVLGTLLELPADIEIIAVDDGSLDDSRTIIEGLKSPLIRLVVHKKNQGKGAAIRDGIRCASGDIIAIQDADLEYNPRELLMLAEYISRNEADVVFGSRFLRKNPCIYKRYYWGNKIISGIISFIAGKKFTDSYTCYKLFRKEILSSFHLTSNGFEIEAELCMRSARGNFKIMERPISYAPRSIKAGKKIGWKDAFRGVYTALLNKFN